MNPNSTPKSRSADHVSELDGLRGVLALCVALSHIVLWCAFAERGFGGRAMRLYHSFIYAHWAVQVFFILSGFAISYLIYSRRPSFGAFMAGRFFRIYPVYLVCIGLSFVAAIFTPFVLENAAWRTTSYFHDVKVLVDHESSAPWHHFVAHLTLLNGLLSKDVLPGAAATVLVPAWSISVEWQFYLAALAIVAAVRRPVALICICAIGVLGSRFGTPWINPMPAFLPLVLPFFLVGIGSYHLYALFVKHGAQRSRRNAVFVGAAFGAALLLRWHTMALLVWIAAFGSLFVERAGVLGTGLTIVRNILAHPIAQWLGRISYPLYLVHWPLLILLLAALLKFAPEAHALQALGWLLGAGLPMMLGAAHLLHRTVEAPLMRFGKRLTQPGRSIRNVAAPVPSPAAPAPVGLALGGPRD